MQPVLIRLERVFLPVAGNRERRALYDWRAAVAAHPQLRSGAGEAHPAHGVTASL
jgi:hypothetical protein